MGTSSLPSRAATTAWWLLKIYCPKKGVSATTQKGNQRAAKLVVQTIFELSGPTFFTLRPQISFQHLTFEEPQLKMTDLFWVDINTPLNWFHLNQN